MVHPIGREAPTTLSTDTAALLITIHGDLASLGSLSIGECPYSLGLAAEMRWPSLRTTAFLEMHYFERSTYERQSPAQSTPGAKGVEASSSALRAHSVIDKSAQMSAISRTPFQPGSTAPWTK